MLTAKPPDMKQSSIIHESLASISSENPVLSVDVLEYSSGQWTTSTSSVQELLDVSDMPVRRESLINACLSESQKQTLPELLLV